jgi:hypothetical protein
MLDDEEGRIWEAYLSVKLDKMKERFEISVPWSKQIRSIAEGKLLRASILRSIDNDKYTISKELEIDASSIRRMAYQMESEGVLTVDRHKTPFRLARGH